MKAALQKVNELLIAPCLIENEPYGIRSRKMFTIAFAMIAINALFIGIPLTIVAAIYDPTVGAYITGAALAQVTVTSAIVPYLYLRVMQNVPPWLADFQMWSTVPIMISFSLFNHQGSANICNSVIFLVTVVMRVRGWYILVLIGILANLNNVLINDFQEQIPELHAALFHTHILSVKLMYLVGAHMCPLIFFAGGLFFIMKEFGERSDQADAAIAMNLAVADKLRRYDTDGVAVILAANKGKVEEKLLEAFAGIQQNLEEYRPHIPDYVIAATITESNETDVEVVDDDDEGDNSLRVTESTSYRSGANNKHNASFLGDCSSHSNTNPHQYSGTTNESLSNTGKNQSVTRRGDVLELSGQNHNSNSNQLILASSGDANESSITSAGGQVVTTPLEHSSPTSGRNLRRNVPYDLKEFSMLSASKDTRSSISTSQHAASTSTKASSGVSGGGGAGSSMHHSKKGAISTTSKTFTGRATTVYVRFVSASCGSVKNTDGSVPARTSTALVVDLLCKGVEAAARLSKAHSGALQYMQGCGVMVSFNATSRVLAHESKACAFALALKHEIDALPGTPIVLHASIVTTSVLSFFAGNKGQLLLTVVGGYMPVHTAMHHFMTQMVGDDISCVLVSRATVPNAELLFEMRTLGAILLSSTLQQSASPNGPPDLPTFLDHNKKGPPELYIRADAIQLLSARATSTSDEWMYELENQQSVHNFTKQIAEAAEAGDFQTAMQLISDNVTAISSDVILTRCLQRRVDASAENGADFTLRKMPPTKMW